MNIYVQDGSLKIPEDETCYIIGKDGIFLKKKLDLIDSLTKVDKISFLSNVDTFAKMNIPKIPEKLFGNIFSFFRIVFEKYKSESIVLLFFNVSKKEYKIYVPEQIVSPASLEYSLDKTIEGFRLIGTIHSHGSMSAFHSTTDVHDEEGFDGIHITIGKVDSDNFEVSTSIVVNGFRSKVQSDLYIEGISLKEEVVNEKQFFGNFSNIVKKHYVFNKKKLISFDKKWLKYVKEKEIPVNYVNFLPFGNSDKLEGVLTESLLTGIPITKQNNKCNNSFSNCEFCIHRNEKLKLQNVKKIPVKECKNNFKFENYNFWSDDLW